MTAHDPAQPDDGHTIGVGHVHTLTDDGVCRDDCPHPDHAAQPVAAAQDGEVEGLAEWLCDQYWRAKSGDGWHDLAQAFLASDWLAQRDARRDNETAAKALEEAAEYVASPEFPSGGGDWLDGAIDVVDFLRDRAARLRGDGRAG